MQQTARNKEQSKFCNAFVAVQQLQTHWFTLAEAEEEEVVLRAARVRDAGNRGGAKCSCNAGVHGAHGVRLEAQQSLRRARRLQGSVDVRAGTRRAHLGDWTGGSRLCISIVGAAYALGVYQECCTKQARAHRVALWVQRNDNVCAESLVSKDLVADLGKDFCRYDVVAACAAVLLPQKR